MIELNNIPTQMTSILIFIRFITNTDIEGMSTISYKPLDKVLAFTFTWESFLSRYDQAMYRKKYRRGAFSV